MRFDSKSLLWLKPSGCSSAFFGFVFFFLIIEGLRIKPNAGNAKEVKCIKYVHHFPSSTRDQVEKGQGQSSQSSPEPNCGVVCCWGLRGGCVTHGASTRLWYSLLVLFMSGTSIPGRAAPSPAMPRDWDPPGNTVLQNPDGETTVYKIKMDIFFFSAWICSQARVMLEFRTLF